jgi:hypothetical protein
MHVPASADRPRSLGKLPRVSWRLGLVGDHSQNWGSFIVMDSRKFRWGGAAELAVKSSFVEPVAVLQHNLPHFLEPAPGAVFANQLSLVGDLEGFGQGVFVSVAPRPHRANRSRFGKSLRLAHGQVLGRDLDACRPTT